MAIRMLKEPRRLLIASAAASALPQRSMRMRITVEGESFDVKVEVLPDAVLPAPGLETEALPESVLRPPLPEDIRPEDRICRSPIAGAVVSVFVCIGDFVRKDDPIAVIEAMKMLTTIGAPVDGVVEEVGVTAGVSVKPGQMLCRLA